MGVGRGGGRGYVGCVGFVGYVCMCVWECGVWGGDMWGWVYVGGNKCVVG